MGLGDSMIPPSPNPPTSPPLGEVHEHWDIRRLRKVAEMRLSNVDKHIGEGEFLVLLCNYVNIYKNGLISLDMAFMGATASQEEIEIQPGARGCAHHEGLQDFGRHRGSVAGSSVSRRPLVTVWPCATCQSDFRSGSGQAQ